MGITEDSFWQSAVSAANLSDAWRTRAQYFENLLIQLTVGDRQQRLGIHRGRLDLIDPPLLRTPDLSLSGPTDEWQALADGRIPFVRAVNPIHGRITASGGALAAIWATPILSELFRITALHDA